MVSKAIGRFIRVSPSKARLVADHIRGRRVAEALAMLRYAPQSAARLVEKVLRSAIANAEHNRQVRALDDLRVGVIIDGGPSMKRIQPRAMGRAFWIRHRTSHITVTLAEADASRRPAGERARRKGASRLGTTGRRGAQSTARGGVADPRRAAGSR